MTTPSFPSTTKRDSLDTGATWMSDDDDDDHANHDDALLLDMEYDPSLDESHGSIPLDVLLPPPVPDDALILSSDDTDTNDWMQNWLDSSSSHNTTSTDSSNDSEWQTRRSSLAASMERSENTRHYLVEHIAQKCQFQKVLQSVRQSRLDVTAALFGECNDRNNDSGRRKHIDKQER